MSSDKKYCCIRCGYSSQVRQAFIKHTNRKVLCDPVYSDAGADQLLQAALDKIALTRPKQSFCPGCNKGFSHSSNMYTHKKICPVLNPKPKVDIEGGSSKTHAPQKEPSIVITPSELLQLRQENQRLRNELLRYKTHRTEDFYQVIVENWLGGTHRTNAAGVTDVTNDTTHAEIKVWKEWKYAMGQLMAYQTEDPKEHLYACFFGKYDNECKKKAIKVLNERGISCYEFAEKDGIVSVINTNSGDCVYDYNLYDQDLIRKEC